MRVEKARRRDLAQPRHSGGVAQWIEQEPSKLKVAGSIPAAPALRNPRIRWLSSAVSLSRPSDPFAGRHTATTATQAHHLQPRCEPGPLRRARTQVRPRDRTEAQA
jgi:hypothetical protein